MQALHRIVIPSQADPSDRSTAVEAGSSSGTDRAGRALLGPDQAAPSPAGPAARRLVVALARAVHERGIPSHRLETSVRRVAARLGETVGVFATPTAVHLAFEQPAEGGAGEQRVHLIRSDQGEVDLGRIARLDELIEDVYAGRVGAAEGLERVRAIGDAPPSFPRALVPPAFAVASGAAARFFGGGGADVLASAVLGLAVGLAALAVQRREGAARVFEPLAAFGVTVVAALCALALPVTPQLVTLAALIVLVPGFTLTTAMSELAVRHLVAGTARVAGALVTFLAIGLGLGLGTRVVEALLPEVLGLPPASAVFGWADAVALVLSPLAFTVLFQARPRDAGWILATSLVGWLAAQGGGALLGGDVAAFTGSLAVGIASNLCARHLRRPVSVTQVPGIMLLVPGSIGYRSVAFFLASDVQSGVEAAFRMLMVATALVGGLLMANVLVPPRREL